MQSTSLLQYPLLMPPRPLPPRPLNKKTDECYCSKKSLITFSVIVFVIVTIAFTVSFVIYAVNLFANHSSVVNDIKEGVVVVLETADKVIELIQEADESIKLVNVLTDNIRTAVQTGTQLADDISNI